MSKPEQRRQMAAAIVDLEARRDAAGHLMISDLSGGNGGGAYEIAGIDARYNRATAKTLYGLIGRQRFDEAEQFAIDFIARKTDCTASWTDVPAVEFYLRDCVFNRGATGGALILQRALGVRLDGKVGPVTRSAATAADPADLLARLRTAREQYEREIVRRDERSKSWAGLAARWDKAITIAESYPMARSTGPSPSVTIEPAAGIATDDSGKSAEARPMIRSAGNNRRRHFPPCPEFRALVTKRQREALFGRYEYTATPQPHNPEAIRIVGNWERDNIIEVPIPQLRKALGNRAPNSIRFHRLAAEQLQALWAEWEAAGLLARIVSFDGGFAARFVRGSRSVLSNHAFGSAFDINQAHNPFGQRPASNGRKGSVRDLVPIANRYGFYWGGHYQSRPEGAHFEIAVLDRRVAPQPLPAPAIAAAPPADIGVNAVQTAPLPAGTLPPTTPA